MYEGYFKNTFNGRNVFAYLRPRPTSKLTVSVFRFAPLCYYRRSPLSPSSMSPPSPPGAQIPRVMPPPPSATKTAAAAAHLPLRPRPLRPNSVLTRLGKWGAVANENEEEKNQRGEGEQEGVSDNGHHGGRADVHVEGEGEGEGGWGGYWCSLDTIPPFCMFVCLPLEPRAASDSGLGDSLNRVN